MKNLLLFILLFSMISCSEKVSSHQTTETEDSFVNYQFNNKNSIKYYVPEAKDNPMLILDLGLSNILQQSKTDIDMAISSVESDLNDFDSSALNKIQQAKFVTLSYVYLDQLLPKKNNVAKMSKALINLVDKSTPLETRVLANSLVKCKDHLSPKEYKAISSYITSIPDKLSALDIEESTLTRLLDDYNYSTDIK